MRMKVLIVLVSIFSPLTLLGQSISFKNNQKELRFSLDFASFRHGEKKIYVEFYYSFFSDQLLFVDQDSQMVAIFNIDAKIFLEDSLYLSQNWYNKSLLPEAEEVRPNRELFTLTYFILPPGNYHYKTKIRDISSGLEGIQEMDLNLTAYPEEELTLSDIELANSISSDTTKGLFTKSHYRVIPNPNALYGLEKPMLYFYAEIYNLSKQMDSAYSVEYAILDREGNELRTYPRKTRQKPATSLVEVGGFNVVTFPTGSYYFELRVFDKGNLTRTSKRKKFFIYRTGEPFDLLTSAKIKDVGGKPNVLKDKTNPLFSYYEHATQEQIDEEFYSAAYRATKEEAQVFKTLDLEGKRHFMVQFWSERDDNPQTVRNEGREEHLSRLKYANENFGGFKKGWQTDRGRVLLKYGVPDEVERNPSLGNSRAYEVWRYFQLEGGILFVFVDKGGWQDLELVHSNARGEIYDPDWQRWISVQ